MKEIAKIVEVPRKKRVIEAHILAKRFHFLVSGQISKYHPRRSPSVMYIMLKTMNVTPSSTGIMMSSLLRMNFSIIFSLLTKRFMFRAAGCLPAVLLLQKRKRHLCT